MVHRLKKFKVLNPEGIIIFEGTKKECDEFKHEYYFGKEYQVI